MAASPALGEDAGDAEKTESAASTEGGEYEAEKGRSGGEKKKKGGKRKEGWRRGMAVGHRRQERVVMEMKMIKDGGGEDYCGE
ncbi:hypothetical protein PIB30_100209 [Stylosanthes scabra]|uniref:Uncharacterized protein n=1 Tax=Stylosanthes scabra TaxID=79078 RepID=A0ABU6ZVP0_9FABA|nr:hypothetical protein [Stylosanthes scabra]